MSWDTNNWGVGKDGSLSYDGLCPEMKWGQVSQEQQRRDWEREDAERARRFEEEARRERADEQRRTEQRIKAHQAAAERMDLIAQYQQQLDELTFEGRRYAKESGMYRGSAQRYVARSLTYFTMMKIFQKLYLGQEMIELDRPPIKMTREKAHKVLVENPPEQGIDLFTRTLEDMLLKNFDHYFPREIEMWKEEEDRIAKEIRASEDERIAKRQADAAAAKERADEAKLAEIKANSSFGAIIRSCFGM